MIEFKINKDNDFDELVADLSNQYFNQDANQFEVKRFTGTDDDCLKIGNEVFMSINATELGTGRLTSKQVLDLMFTVKELIDDGI